MSTSQAPQPRFEQLLADPTLDAAYAWQAETTPHPLDWATAKQDLRTQLAGGEYAFAPLHRVQTADGPVDQWAETDAIVLKALTLVLHAALGDAIAPHVYHLHGGSEAALTHVQQHLADHPDAWVMKSDVAGYDAHIDHTLLYHQVADLLPGETYLLRLVWQYLRHSVEDGGDYLDVEQGLARGCPLSPLMGALYLKPLDELLERESAGYARFMDDWVALFPTRWGLRRAVAQANLILDGLKLAQHPDKTFIGRAAKGFDLLGYRLAPGAAPRVSEVALHRRDERVARLYEPGADEARIERYLARWQGWVQGGMRETVVVPRPAPRPAAIKRLGQLGISGACATLGAPAGAAMVDISLNATFPRSASSVRTTGSSGMYVAAVANDNCGCINVVTYSGYGAYAGGLFADPLGRWRFSSVGVLPSGHLLSVNAAAGGVSALRVWTTATGTTAGLAIGSLGQLTKQVYFSNGTGAGWATVSANSFGASVEGAINTAGCIDFGGYTAVSCSVTAPPGLAVPAPPTLALLALGASVILPFARRRRQAGVHHDR